MHPYYVKIYFFAASPYYNPNTLTSCESLGTYHSWLHDIPQSQRRYIQMASQIIVGLALLLLLAKVMARVCFLFFSLALAKAMQISRSIK